MPATVKTYSYAQLEALWIQAGGSKAKAPIMAAIAIAESGGRPTAISPKNKDGSVDRGLWQINSVHGSLSTTDPLANAQAAVKIEGTQGLKAWTTYRTGAYKQFLKGNVSPDNNGLPTGSTSTATDASLSGDIGGAIGQGFADAFKAMLQPLISLMIWGSEIMLGGALMLFGVIVFIINTQAGKDATKTVGKVGLDVASVAAPEAAPELQAAKGGVPGPTKLVSARASRTAAQTKKARAARAKQQAAAAKKQQEGNTSETEYGTGGKKAKVKSA